MREVTTNAGVPPPRASRTRRILLILLYGAGLALFTELAARAMVRLQPHLPAAPGASVDLEAAGRALGLDPYEMVDPMNRSNWRLRAGLRMSFGQVLEKKRSEGHLLAVQYLEKRAAELHVAPDTLAIAIDAAGFRGPEVDPSHARPRVLAIGDSCTFGTALGEQYPYPRVVERALGAAGRPVEVINAGVEGYGPKNVLLRIEEFERLEPEVTTIYLGWNALFAETFFETAYGPGRYSTSLRLLHDAWARATAGGGDARRQALAAYERPKHPDRSAPEVKALEHYVPFFMPDLVRIVDAMQTAGSRVVLVTLPGLYTMDETPDAATLAKGHLPQFTDNPFVLARMAERYNECLRELARARHLEVIDLEAWSRTTLTPRSQHFFDSVHLDEPSQGLIGEKIAAALLKDIPAPVATATAAHPAAAAPPRSPTR
jgi:lysophospholipase L1-like esterase